MPNQNAKVEVIQGLEAVFCGYVDHKLAHMTRVVDYRLSIIFRRWNRATQAQKNRLFRCFMD